MNRIKVVLASLDKSNKWLADKLDKNPNTISRWVNNLQQPSIETLFEIGQLLEVEPCELLVKLEDIED